jgi:hypothetical protein
LCLRLSLVVAAGNPRDKRIRPREFRVFRAVVDVIESCLGYGKESTLPPDGVARVATRNRSCALSCGERCFKAGDEFELAPAPSRRTTSKAVRANTNGRY